jgi:hypothetical protein
VSASEPAGGTSLVKLFTNEEAWIGGFYELALEYGRSPDPQLINGLKAMWGLDVLEGCFLDRDREPNDQERLTFQPSLLDHGHILGIASVPGDTRVACGTAVCARASTTPKSSPSREFPEGDMLDSLCLSKAS